MHSRVRSCRAGYALGFAPLFRIICKRRCSIIYRLTVNRICASGVIEGIGLRTVDVTDGITEPFATCAFSGRLVRVSY